MRHGIRIYGGRRKSFGKLAFGFIFMLAYFVDRLSQSSFETKVLVIILVVLAIALIAIAIWAFIQRNYRKSFQEKARLKALELSDKALELSDIDNMDGFKFEHYVATILTHKGYETEVTPGSGDLGVDIVAKKDMLKFAVQVKRQSSPVSRRAVSDAVGGISHYECDYAMVVTSYYFTPGATICKTHQDVGLKLSSLW